MIGSYQEFKGALAIRTSSVCFLLTFICTLLYAGWMGADRMFNARTILAEEVKKTHGVRLSLEGAEFLENGILQIEKSEVSLGKHGSGFLEGIRVENQKIEINNGVLYVFEDNPWQWVYGFCGQGQKAQVLIKNLVVKTASGKVYSLGRFDIQTSSSHTVKGSCEAFIVEQTSDDSYVVEGDLGAYIPIFDKLIASAFLKISLPKVMREMNGSGHCVMELTALQSLLFGSMRPILLSVNWRNKSLEGYASFENTAIELQLTHEKLELKTFGNGEGFIWNGKTSSDKEEYQVYVEGDVTLSSLLKSGAFFDRFQVPDLWQSKLNGLYEFKREIKSKKLEIKAISENRTLDLFEVAK